jgi:hypothetical protein
MQTYRAVSFMLLLGILVVSCIDASPHPHQAELRAAFEHSREVLAEARFNLDTSRLPQVFTKESLPDILEEIEDWKAAGDTVFRAEEIEIDWVAVVEYNPPEAIIEVKYFYRAYTYNRGTGEITYDSESHRYWRIIKYRMLQEDGAWKVDKALEFVDWSG